MKFKHGDMVEVEGYIGYSAEQLLKRLGRL